MPTFSNILRPLRASMSAMSCGRGDDDGAGHGHLLRERELDVAGARRQVDDQVVEVAPPGLREQLLERLGDHRPAPDHRRVRLDQEAHAHRLQAVAFHRLHGLAVARGRAPGDAEHERLRRAVDVGVEHADGGALGGERQREVDRRGALAHAALARGHRDDVLDPRDELHAALHRVRDDLRLHVQRSRGPRRAASPAARPPARARSRARRAPDSPAPRRATTRSPSIFTFFTHFAST